MNKIISLNDLLVVYNHPAHLVIVVNLQGAVEYVNASLAPLLGYWEENLIGKALASIVHPDDNANEVLEFYNNDGRTYNHQAVKRLRNSEGAYRYFSWSFTKPGDKSLIYAIAQDCTDSMELDEIFGSSLMHMPQKCSSVIEQNKNLPWLNESFTKNTNNTIEREESEKVMMTENSSRKAVNDKNDVLKNIAWKQSHLMRSPLTNLKSLMIFLKEDPGHQEYMGYMQNELEKLDSIIKEMVYEISVAIALADQTNTHSS